MSVLTMEQMGEAVATASRTARELPPSMVERMTLILDLFTTRRTWLGLEDIVQATGLPRSTTHRILEQLVRLEWIEHGNAGYGLGRRSLVLGGGAGDHADLRSAASPYLHDLLLKTGAVIHLAVLEEGRVRYLDKLGGRFAAAVPSRVGGSAPAHCTGLGKAMLAWLEPEQVDELVGSELPARTAATIADLDVLHGELARVRARGGLALERGECYPDIACVAAAVRGPRGPVGSISVVAAASTTLERMAPLVVSAARRIAADLFPDVDARSRRLNVVD
ncbi:IclR family transcriptional regulator [Nocardioides sp. zg-536]|uniref:IclR family transcriptional regulator n=1 Tax=Nocardioides faecalis TaxID=2803858 RepID=A0A938Y1E4_9ACTN|nr:IclR family transcriptional regulator [Nocardioides faecalis]MBM9460126.1 IclR family transcriptional regulator [Nocardioides faecalis]QVI60079.1 IclR family transcriptional regulator [Nocardioides faecalis]